MTNIVIILLMLFIIYYINKSFTRKNKSYVRFKILDEIDRNIILRMINDGDYESIKKNIHHIKKGLKFMSLFPKPTIIDKKNFRKFLN